MPGLDRRVSLLVKELPSYAWVRETYLDNAKGLPDLPWLHSRELAGDRPQLATGTGA